MIRDTIVVLTNEMNSNSINWLQVLVTSIPTLILGLILAFWKKSLQEKLEFVKNEFIIIQTSFSNNYTVIMEYYSTFFKHYRDCQNVAYKDIIDYPDGSSKTTEKIFWDNLDDWVENVNKNEAKIKLILSEHILQINEQSISVFNEFRNLVRSYDGITEKPKNLLHSKFVEIDNIKKNLAKELKTYLRTEKLYPE